jgi:UDP-N-acetylmuramyl pentapeptide phosphotransferase/UDP-N-acetylglucosamine-1-phosphate transferase
LEAFRAIEYLPVVAGGAAFLVAGALVPILVRFAVGRNLMDVPNLRSSHETPTPRLGGVAIILGTWVGVIVLRPEGALPLLVTATLIGLVGLADDISNLGFKVKAAAQAVVAAGLLLAYPPEILAGAPGALKVLVLSVGVFWIVALSNAFNFMDGIDGFTGGVALVNMLFLAPLVGDARTALIALAGATAGFLIWNINPASIFIGDAGAYFLGFGLAAFALYAPVSPEGWTPLGFLACVVVFTPYLFDTGYTLVRRFLAGKNVFSAHREHIYQRITPTTAMHRRTSNLYYGASVVAGFAALLVASGGAWLIAGFALALACCAGLAALPYLVDAEKETR